MTQQMIVDRMAGTMNGLGEFTVQDGINIANAATGIYTSIYDTVKNNRSTSSTTSNTTPQVVYVTQPTGSSTSTYTPSYYQTQNNDNTLLYVALGGLALFAVYSLTKKK